MKSIKKFGGLLLTLVLVMSMLSIVAFAEAPAGYTELDLEWELGYYTNQSGNKPLTDSANGYASTQKFTKEDLPNGTKIVFTKLPAAGTNTGNWRYRLATWVVTEDNGETLIDNTTENVYVTETITVTVDDAWWGENTTCAFSINEKGVYTMMKDRTEDLSQAFKIYVPTSTGGDTGSNTEHTHAHGTEWKKDADNHWNECACGDKANKAAHADANVDGKCDVCAYEVAADNDNPQTGDNSMITLWVTLLCVSACGFVVIMMSRKKSAF